jgi:hypothetical protein
MMNKVTGTITFQANQEIIEWICPQTGITCYSQGEHYYDEELDAYVHDVYQEDSLIIDYIVVAL